MSYYSDEEELDIRVRRGRASPVHPAIYPEHRYTGRPTPRPYYGETSSYLIPHVSSHSLQRSRSTGHRNDRSPPTVPVAPQPQPVIIDNRRINYNDYEDEDYGGLAPRHGRRSRSRSRSHSRPEAYAPREPVYAQRDPREEYELERTRRELEVLRLSHNRDEIENDRYKRELDERTRREMDVLRLTHNRDEIENERYKRELEERTRKELEQYKEAHSREEYEKEKLRRDLEWREYEQESLRREQEKLRRELEKKRISSTKEDFELEKTKKELKAFKDAQEREEEEKRIKKEMELKRLLEEKKAADEKARLKKETDAAIEKFKAEQAEKDAKAKKAKEENEKDYQKRLEEDLRKSGMDERQISVVLKKDKGVDPNRPTYTRMSRRHLSIETLNRYRVDYEFDQVSSYLPKYEYTSTNKAKDPDYVLIKRWVPEYEQDFLWAHTREIRERRREPVLVAIEGKKHRHHETDFELVRKTKHERKPSPSPLLTFLAGGKR